MMEWALEAVVFKGVGDGLDKLLVQLGKATPLEACFAGPCSALVQTRVAFSRLTILDTL